MKRIENWSDAHPWLTILLFWALFFGSIYSAYVFLT
jgi:hypothetical protein